MHQFRFCFRAVVLVWAAAAAVYAADGSRTVDNVSRPDPDGEPIDFLPAPASTVAEAEAAGCRKIGDFITVFSGASRFRGDVFRIERTSTLLEIQLELAFQGTTNLYCSIHRREEDGTWARYPHGATDVVIEDATNPDYLRVFYSTGTLQPPVVLEAGYDYMIGCAWGGVSIVYGRDTATYPAATPPSFLAGQVLGNVSRNIPPPLPETFTAEQIIVSSIGAYSMQFCFEPVPGACCSSSTLSCQSTLEAACVATGSYFHGEWSKCSEVVCEFGACCRACGTCDGDFVDEACSPAGVTHWSGAACPADPEDLCPPVTGACCQSGTCTEVCGAECGGVYRGDGTVCDPDPCQGACCVSGGCLNRTQSACAGSNGVYKGDGTTCLTLPAELECGGACCSGFAQDDLAFCEVVAHRSLCAYDPKGLPFIAYRGDGTRCPADCDDQDYWACCLPDGDCINTTASFCGAPWVKGEFTINSQCPDIACSMGGCCFQDGTCDVLTETGCLALGGAWLGDGSTCGAGVCGGGACCGTDLGPCVIRTPPACVLLGGTHEGSGTDCDSPASICPGIGACCYDHGGCDDYLTAGQCALKGGTHQGDGTTCADPGIACDRRGACCAETGLCRFITETQCDVIGGVFKGLGVTCTSSRCPAGACCMAGECEKRTAVSCEAEMGVYYGDGVACTVNACDVGACCKDEICTPDQMSLACTRGGGVFVGEGTDCGESGTCLLGACCEPDCDCAAGLLGFACGKVDGLFYAGEDCLSISCEAAIESSAPPDCAIDARQTHDPADNVTPVGWTSVDLAFPCGMAGLTAEDFEVTVQPPGSPPGIDTVTAVGRTVTVTFDAPIDPGAYTCITHVVSGSMVCLGYLPSDTNGNRTSDATDITDLARHLDGYEPAMALWQCDIDRGGACTPLDLLRAVDLQNGAEQFSVWGGATLPACPSAGP